MASGLWLQEFEEWQKTQSDFVLYLVDNTEQPNSSVQLEFSFCEDGSQFSLICPTDYRGSKSGFCITSDSSNLKAWLTRMKQYLTSTKNQVKLAAVLAKAVEFYRDRRSKGVLGVGTSRDADASQLVDSDFEDEGLVPDEDAEAEHGSSDSDLANDLDWDDGTFTTEWEIQIDLKKKKWLAKEHELRNKLKQEKTSDDRSYADANSFSGPGSAEEEKRPRREKSVRVGQQIFEHESAAFQILSNELVALLKNGKEDGFFCDAIEDNLYSWNVKISKFPETSTLYADLKKLQSTFGYDFVELQLDFVFDFPFYPPLLRVVRPRFQGSLVQSLASIDLLKLTYWNPTKSVRDVLKQIRDILLKHARVSVDAYQNDIAKHSEGAYLPIEDILIKLALAAEVRPRANWSIIDIDNLEKAPELKPLEKPATEKSVNHSSESTSSAQDGSGTFASFAMHRGAGGTGGWKAGTGYGRGALQSGWNPEAYIKAQHEKDAQILKILKSLNAELYKIKDNWISFADDIYALFEGSAFVPFLEAQLSVISLIEIGRHAELFDLVLDALGLMADCPVLLPLFCNLPHQQQCIMAMLAVLKNNAMQYLKHVDRTQSSAAIAAGSSSQEPVQERTRNKHGFAKSPSVPASISVSGVVLPTVGVSHDPAMWYDDDYNELEVAERMSGRASHVSYDSVAGRDLVYEVSMKICGLMEKLHTVLSAQRLTYSTEKQSTLSFSNEPSTTRKGRSATRNEPLEEQYVRVLKPYQYGSFSVQLDGVWKHKFADHASDKLSSEVKSIIREWTSLQSSLPLFAASSIFVRVDEDHVNLMEVLITGPDDTPYANGCFLFHVCFPSTYPRVPPLVSLSTTGGGTVRFNPNLYNCGKVCLSLLGTWSGDRGEKWNADTSTLLQVLVSIQSLILVPEPYFNEPGFEGAMGTKEGQDQSDRYNNTVRCNCVKWAMLEMLKSPPPAFQSVVQYHFKMKKDKILEVLDKWLADSPSDQLLKSSVSALKKELNQLSKIQLPLK